MGAAARRTGTALAVALLLVVAGSAVVALAGGGSVPTSLKLHNHDPAFHGKVVSSLGKCEPDRRVKMFRQGGDRLDRRGFNNVTLLGRTDSGPDGYWKIPVDPLPRGRYYAKVKKHVVGVRGVPYVCEDDFSRTLTVD